MSVSIVFLSREEFRNYFVMIADERLKSEDVNICLPLRTSESTYLQNASEKTASVNLFRLC